MAKAKPEFLVTLETYEGSINARCETEGQARALVNLIAALNNEAPGNPHGLASITVHEVRGQKLGKLILELGEV